MKKPHIKDLQAELLGSVTESPEVVKHFSTDASIFQITPEAVVYPHNTADVRRTVAFVAKRAADGKAASLTARGLGSDVTGAAIGSGLSLVFPGHMNRVLKLEKGSVTVQPGATYGTLQQTLITHGRFLPPYPASLDFSTIGGALANNASGDKSVKYGTTRDFVEGLKVVLSDGSLIETRRLSPRELSRRKGLSTFEGQIYRGLDGILTDHAETIARAKLNVARDLSGYALSKVKGRDGSFDLGQIFVGSQGTLGIITEATLKTCAYNQRTTVVVGFFADIKAGAEAIRQVRRLRPSSLELVDGQFIAYMQQHRAGDIDGQVPEELPKLTLIVEFDDFSQLQQTLKGRRAERMFKRLATTCRATTDPLQQEAIWKIRRSVTSVLWMNHGSRRALPFIEDAIVPADKFVDFLPAVYKLLGKHDIEAPIWGHAGDGQLHLQPFLDLSKKSDVERMFKLSRDFYELVRKHGGAMSGSNGVGLLRAPYLSEQLGEGLIQVNDDVKRLFDPHNILNPGKKIIRTQDDIKTLIRSEYSLSRFFDYLPRN